MTNRQLLAGIAGLAVLTGVLTLIVVFRENSNATAIADLQAELRAVRQQSESRDEKLQSAIDLTNTSLRSAVLTLATVQKALSQEVKAHGETRTHLSARADELAKARKRLDALWSELAAFKKQLVEIEKRLPPAPPNN